MLRNEKSIESLALLAAILKKTLLDVEQRKSDVELKLKRTMNDIKHSQKELTFCKGEIAKLQAENEKIKETFNSCKQQWEHEKKYLKSKLSKMQFDGDAGKQSLKRILDESPIPIPKQAKLDARPPSSSRDKCEPQDHIGEKIVLDGVSNISVNRTANDSDIVDLTDSPGISKKVESIVNSESPYLPVKMNIAGLSYDSMIGGSKFLSQTKGKYSIFKQPSGVKDVRQPKLSDSFTYNGLGGTSKSHIFPEPKSRTLGELRVKPLKQSKATTAKPRLGASMKESLNTYLNTSR